MPTNAATIPPRQRFTPTEPTTRPPDARALLNPRNPLSPKERMIATEAAFCGSMQSGCTDQAPPLLRRIAFQNYEKASSHLWALAQKKLQKEPLAALKYAAGSYTLPFRLGLLHSFRIHPNNREGIRMQAGLYCGVFLGFSFIGINYAEYKSFGTNYTSPAFERFIYALDIAL